MAKIAVDVVLLPDKAMTEKAIALNAGLDDKIRLHAERCLPHISLVMGCIEETAIPEVMQALQGVVQNYDPFYLVADKIYNNSGVGMSFQANVALQQLHEDITAALTPYLSYDATMAMLVQPTVPENISVPWIKAYWQASSYEHFFPHLTLGFGETPTVDLPIPFDASTVALCHLGNYCTCRKVLGKVGLT